MRLKTWTVGLQLGGNVYDHVIVFLACCLSFALGSEPPYLVSETGKYTYYIENHDIYALCYYCPETASRSDEDAVIQDTRCISKNFDRLDPEEGKNHWYPYCNKGLVPSCKNPPQIRNGNLTKITGFPGYSVYSKWQVICHNGYRIKSGIQELYRCAENRNWSSNIDILSTEVCIAEVCLPLPEILNGTWHCNHTQKPVPVGGACHLRCDKGFLSNTNGTRFCNNDLKWEGTNNTLSDFYCNRLDVGVSEKPNDQPIIIIVGGVILSLCVLAGALFSIYIFKVIRNKRSTGTSNYHVESDSKSIEMTDCTSKLCSEGRPDSGTTCPLSPANEKQNKNGSVTCEKNRKLIYPNNTEKEAKKKYKTKYKTLTQNMTSKNQQNKVKFDEKENEKSETISSVAMELNDKTGNNVEYVKKENALLHGKMQNYELYNRESYKKEKTCVPELLHDKAENNVKYDEKENEKAEKCVLSISDALDDKKLNDFFRRLCKIFDGLDEWPGLVKTVLNVDEYTIKSVEKHRKGDPEDGFTNYFIHGEFKSQNTKLGHILNYIDKAFKTPKHKNDAMMLFKEYHMDCEFCCSIYS